jgi:hypothetical protein
MREQVRNKVLSTVPRKTQIQRKSKTAFSFRFSLEDFKPTEKT